MLIAELLNTASAEVLLEGKHLELYEELIPIFTIEDTPALVNDVYQTPYGPIVGSRWFRELHGSLKTLAVAQRLAARMKELGIGGEAAKRLKAATKNATKNTKALFNNPYAYHIPVFTTGGAPGRSTLKRFNEAFGQALKAELAKIKVEDLTCNG